jgi:hypothetical protein
MCFGKSSKTGSKCPTKDPSWARAVVCFRKNEPAACCANRLPNHLVRITPTNIGCVQSSLGYWGKCGGSTSEEDSQDRLAHEYSRFSGSGHGVKFNPARRLDASAEP